MSVFEDGGTYCHSCDKSTKRKAEAVEFNLTEKFVSYRGITEKALKQYGIVTGVKTDGTEVYRRYPYPHKSKYRVLPKDFSKNSGFSNDHLFGMDKFNAGTSRTLTIVEGEDDAAAAYQMLGYKYPVVSLPSASGVTETLLRKCKSYLDSFESIVVATDSDSAGDKAAAKLAAIFPNKTYRVSMSKYKDACEFLMNGAEKDFMFAWHNRTKFTPEGVFNSPEQFVDILRNSKSYEYIPTGFSDLDDKIKGLVIGEFHVITGEEGKGKTEVLRSLEYQVLTTRPDVPIAILHMEETNKTTLTSLASYHLKKNVRDPDTEVPEKDIEAAVADLTKGENLYLFNMSEADEPDVILDKVRYFAVGCGCKLIFIDPIQQLAYGKEREDTEERVLSRLSVKLEKLASELGVGIVCTAHVNDDGATRSSRMIGKSASIRLDLSRDHMSDDPDIRNITRISITKNRPFTHTGFGGLLRFDPETFIVSEES